MRKAEAWKLWTNQEVRWLLCLAPVCPPPQPYKGRSPGYRDWALRSDVFLTLYSLRCLGTNRIMTRARFSEFLMDPLSTEKTRRTNKALLHFENGQKGRNTIINKYKKLERYSEIQENRVLKNLVVFSINDVVESTKNYWQGPLPTAGGTDIIPVAIPRRIS